MRAIWPEISAFGSKWCPITPMYDRFIEALAPVFAGAKPDVTEENFSRACAA